MATLEGRREALLLLLFVVDLTTKDVRRGALDDFATIDGLRGLLVEEEEKDNDGPCGGGSGGDCAVYDPRLRLSNVQGSLDTNVVVASVRNWRLCFSVYSWWTCRPLVHLLSSSSLLLASYNATVARG